MTFEMLDDRGRWVEGCAGGGMEAIVFKFSSVRGLRRALNNPSNRGSSRFSGFELKCASIKS
jgi:hypothetical protein